MNLIHIESPEDPRLEDYRNVRESDLLNRRGVFMAEGRLVVRTLLSCGRFRARSVLVTEPALESIRDVLADADPALPVFLLAQEWMNRIVGFDIHRGCLASGERPARHVSGVPELLANLGAGGGPARSARPILVPVLEGLTNHDNVGGIFRSAAAFGASGILLTQDCCDPLYRKAIRVSMGAALRVPFATIGPWPGAVAMLRDAGFTVVAMTGSGETDLRELRARPRPQRIALLLGSEGPGLSDAALAAADIRIRISMAPGTDSLNVATAAAIAMYELSGGN